MRPSIEEWEKVSLRETAKRGEQRKDLIAYIRELEAAIVAWDEAIPMGYNFIKASEVLRAIAKSIPGEEEE